MTAPLPAELVAHILKLANEGESPAERQLNRNKFRLVSKGWYSGVDRWREVFVQGSDVDELGDILEADDELAQAPSFSSSIKRLYIDTLPKFRSARTTSHRAIVTLIELCLEVEEMELAVGAGNVDGIRDHVSHALGFLVKMKCFTLRSNTDEPALITLGRLQWQVNHHCASVHQGDEKLTGSPAAVSLLVGRCSSRSLFSTTAQTT